tara:strand:- start:1805 stop:1936 length:132 start_codon:yes stop_codon:yes gene_type:complete
MITFILACVAAASAYGWGWYQGYDEGEIDGRANQQDDDSHRIL